MGVKSVISLKELNGIFKGYDFVELKATKEGIIDTTYIVKTQTARYILKRYERDIEHKIKLDAQLLGLLKRNSLNVPLLLDFSKGWYLYEFLKGQSPKNINTRHITALARFMSKFHSLTYKKEIHESFIQPQKIKQMLCFTKQNFYVYYKKLQPLHRYKPKKDGFIHADIFKDNTLFNGRDIAVFDFIDGGGGEFAFDAGVALVSFATGAKQNYFKRVFFNTYNQKAPKKLTQKELEEGIDMAKKFYALLRINHYKNTKKAKGLLYADKDR